VLASVEANSEVIGLSATGEVLEGELAVVGRDSNAILIEVMGDRVRPQRYQQLLDDFYVKVEAGDFPGARAILAELEAKWGADEPTLGDARWALETEEA
jgi:hypothetical protein